jgi:hypothetical protein
VSGWVSVSPRTVLDVDGQAGDDDRTGTPAPGRTVPEVVSQLEVARRYGVTSRAVGRRVQRVGRAGAALPLYPRVRRELTRLARNGDDVPTRQRCAQLLGVTPSPRGPGSAGPIPGNRSSDTLQGKVLQAGQRPKGSRPQR